MTRGWPPRMSPEMEHFYVQLFGVTCLVFNGFFASGIRFDEPLSLLPAFLIYAWTQAIFRLGVRRARRPLGKRTLVFIA